MEKYKIAIELIELLIKNHDAVDSVVEESTLILHVEKKIAYYTNTDELSECVKLINSIANKKIIKEGWISKGGFLSSGRESSYLTEFQVPTLTKILELLKVVENDEIVDSEFDEIILFQQRWNSKTFEDKKQTARKTDQFNNIGVDFYKKNYFDQAILSFEMALEIMPTNDDALKNLIICYEYLGKWDKIASLKRKLTFLSE